jgi:hypothetical protein
MGHKTLNKDKQNHNTKSLRELQIPHKRWAIQIPHKRWAIHIPHKRWAIQIPPKNLS